MNIESHYYVISHNSEITTLPCDFMNCPVMRIQKLVQIILILLEYISENINKTIFNTQNIMVDNVGQIVNVLISVYFI